MSNNQQLYILGLEIDTPVGKCNPIKVRDYVLHAEDINLFSFNRWKLIYEYKKILANKDDVKQLEALSLFEIINVIPDLNRAYWNIFNLVFKNEIENKISRENFDEIREIILRMNGIQEQTASPNPEIQAAIERSKRVKALEAGTPLEFEDIVSSIVAYTNFKYDEILEMTLYQLYATFYRIGQFKNYDTSTLFATVSTEKLNIESWSKHIDLFASESHAITKDEFNRATGSIFGNK